MTNQTDHPQPLPEQRVLTPNATPEYDSETAALMRCALRPVFDEASSWNALTEALHDRGYSLSFRDGRLCLLRYSDNARICGLRFLGLELGELVARFGRPVVVIRQGGNADGEFLCRYPEVVH